MHEDLSELLNVPAGQSVHDTVDELKKVSDGHPAGPKKATR
jgi:hypothetical protein